MAKNLKGLYKENVFYDIKYINIEWRTRYSLTNFEDHFGLHASVIFLDPNMCDFLHICMLAWSQILMVNWQNYLYYSIRVDLYNHQILNPMRWKGC